MKYVNAYAVTRHYGGSEEGGWWFDAGEPLASVPVTSDLEAKRQIARLTGLFAGHAHGDISSVRGGVALEVFVQNQTAAPFPSQSPRFE